MNSPAKPRRHPPAWSFTAIGVAVAVVIFLGVGPPGAFLPRGTVCALGSVVGTYTIWAPTGMVNFPDGGGATIEAASGELNYTFSSGSLTVGALPEQPGRSGGGVGKLPPDAGIFASYADWNFTFYHTTNTSQIEAASDPCTQPYVASISFAGGFCHSDFSVVPIPDNSTDALEPHTWNGTTGLNTTYNPACPARTPGAYVWFDSTLNLNGEGVMQPFNYDLCNYPENATATLELEIAARLPVVVTVPFEGRSISTAGFLTWNGSGVVPTATYTLPGGWNWTLGPVGPVPWAVDLFTAQLPGLLAFERSAC